MVYNESFYEQHTLQPELSSMAHHNQYVFQNWPFKLHVYGDMGHLGGAPALKILYDSVMSNEVDAIIHVGDFAYDFHSDGGQVSA